jgi:predicted RNase H-like nuclease (RuvC/YqgF family)
MTQEEFEKMNLVDSSQREDGFDEDGLPSTETFSEWMQEWAKDNPVGSNVDDSMKWEGLELSREEIVDGTPVVHAVKELQPGEDDVIYDRDGKPIPVVQAIPQGRRRAPPRRAAKRSETVLEEISRLMKELTREVREVKKENHQLRKLVETSVQEKKRMWKKLDAASEQTKQLTKQIQLRFPKSPRALKRRAIVPERCMFTEIDKVESFGLSDAEDLETKSLLTLLTKESRPQDRNLPTPTVLKF